MKVNLCKDNLTCCDDDCQHCANLIYDRYMKTRQKYELALKDLRGFCSVCKHHGKSRIDFESPCHGCWNTKDKKNWKWKREEEK